MWKWITYKNLMKAIVILFIGYQVIHIAMYFTKQRIDIDPETVEIYWSRRALPFMDEDSEYTELMEITNPAHRQFVLNTVQFLNRTDPMYKHGMYDSMVLDSGASPDNRIQLMDQGKHYEISIEEWKDAFDGQKVYVYGVNEDGLRVMLYRYLIAPEDMGVIDEMYTIVETYYQ